MQGFPAGMQGFNAGMGLPRTSRSAAGEWDSLFPGGDQSDIDLFQSMGNPVFGGPGGPGGIGGGQEDLVFQMMQKLMGDGGFGGGPGIPLPEVRKMKQKEESWGRWWKVLHFLSAVLLSLWVVRCAGWTFKGSLLERVESTNLARSEKPVMTFVSCLWNWVLKASTAATLVFCHDGVGSSVFPFFSGKGRGFPLDMPSASLLSSLFFRVALLQGRGSPRSAASFPHP